MTTIIPLAALPVYTDRQATIGIIVLLSISAVIVIGLIIRWWRY